jgi:tetratricopeptide (TPR) repeat protein
VFASSQDPNETALSTAARAEKAYSASEYSLAAALYQRALQMDAKHSDVKLWYTSLAVCFKALNRYDQCIAMCNKALELQPNLARALNCRGMVYHQTKRLPQALSDLTAAIQADPQPRFLWNRALVRRDLAQWQAAFDDFKRGEALCADPVERAEYSKMMVEMQQNLKPSESKKREEVRTSCSVVMHALFLTFLLFAVSRLLTGQCGRSRRCVQEQRLALSDRAVSVRAAGDAETRRCSVLVRASRLLRAGAVRKRYCRHCVYRGHRTARSIRPRASQPWSCATCVGSTE